MKFFTASITERLLASLNLSDNSKLQNEQEKIYNKIIQNNFKSAKITGSNIKINSKQSEFFHELHSVEL
ncbi:MAG: hypothetical protein JST55_09875 [Bacteroidetes bacterium]|nr:hypothetical protein [Bacteroidota bacterium]